MKQINDRTSRLAYLNEKLGELQEVKVKTEEIKSNQVKQLDELKGKMVTLQ